MSRKFVTLATAMLLASFPVMTFADEQPDATVDYSGGSVALGIGYSWGQGVLHYKGQDYPFHINGLSIANVGASSVQASGSVYHLYRVSDFPGNYTAGSAGVTIAGGVAGTAMSNQNGVVIQMGATTQGLQFTLAPSGIAVAFAGEPTASGSSSPSR
jgi:hypothetical protein